MQQRFERLFFSVGAALLMLVCTACGSDEADDDVTASRCADTTLTYASFGKGFVTSYCASCHAASVTGNARLGAPVDDVFDTRAQIARKVDELKEQVVVMKTMPFGNSTAKPSDAERVKFGQWLDCGAPE
jgi:uncharacterized membrane protein